MRVTYRLFAVACFTMIGLVGCVAGDARSSSAETADHTTVIRYGADDLAALPPGQVLRLDLTVPDTTYSITYDDAASLDHVLVIDDGGQRVLREIVPRSSSVQRSGLKQVVVSADILFSKPAAPAATDAQLSPDPIPDLRIICTRDGNFCCICNNGVCGCGPTVDA
jgi:hypothetical protein